MEEKNVDSLLKQNCSNFLWRWLEVCDMQSLWNAVGATHLGFILVNKVFLWMELDGVEAARSRALGGCLVGSF